jgi:hypothetical protein
VPQVVFGPKDDFGLSRTTINPDFDARIDKSSFAGVRSVSLDFLDGRLTSLWIGYDSGFKWLSVEDFVKGISQSLRLTGTWAPWKSRGQQLRCADFQMTVTIVAEGPSFHIVDQNAEDTLASRRAAKEEQESAATEENDNAEVILGDLDTVRRRAAGRTGALRLCRGFGFRQELPYHVQVPLALEGRRSC